VMWLAVAAMTLGGCLGGYDPNAGADLSLVDMAPPDPAVEFASKIAPLLGGVDGKSGSCGACHAKVGGIGPGFLEAKPDMLTTLLSYPGVIGRTPATSRLFAKGAHEGPALKANEVTALRDWILLFNTNRPMDMTTKPTVPPFVPAMGANVVDLALINLNIAGAKLTFDARMAGSSLVLSNLTVVAPPSAGLHVVHPLFVMWDAQHDAFPDPVDSFATTDLTMPMGSAGDLPPGTLILPDFAAQQSINIVFETIEPKGGSAGGADGGVVGPTSGCKDVALFAATVRPTLAGQCYNCHNGGAGGYTMSASLSDADQCANARGEIDVNTPANSRLRNYPDPGNNAVHTGTNRKLSTATFATYAAALATWAQAEK
jgi:hypothetical protein